MMKILPLFIAMALFVAGCGPVYKTDYRFTTPPTDKGKICANNCLDKMNSCTATCGQQKSECKRIKSLEAENAYLRYVNEQQSKSQPIEKSRSHFENFSACDVGCEERCESVHRICHSNCGGNVIEHRYCTAFCD